MGFFNKLFSSDYRAALAAEAAGDYALAAKRYALAGRDSAVVRMHLTRADRAKSRADEVDALRDAMHWAKEEEDIQLASKALGKALLSQAQAEGITTERDRERVTEAANYLLAAQCFEHAGDAFLTIDDDASAISAYKRGGLVAKLELVLSREKISQDRERAERNGFADYDLHMRGGDRDAAIKDLRICLQNAESQTRYRRLLDELESRLITGGRVVLKNRQGKSVRFCAVEEILIGRDSLCDLVLRTGGVSRQHASISVRQTPSAAQFELGDAGSRNGTRLEGLEIADRIALGSSGCFQLGDHAEIHYEVDAERGMLRLDIRKGIDKGCSLLATTEGSTMPLTDLGVGAQIRFYKGRPELLLAESTSFVLDGESLPGGTVQLIHGDVVTIDGIDIEVG